VPQPAANSLLSLRLPELSAVAEGQTRDSTTGAIASLTRRLAAGEDEAFRQFQSLYFDRLYRFLLVVAHGDETQARESLQETLMRVARHARPFENEDAFWHWLKAIGRNTARDAARSRRRYLSLLERFTRSSQSEAQPVAQDMVLAAALEESVGELEPAERILIEGKYLEGQTVRELAAQSGLSEKAVESRLLRLRRHLRECILKKLKMP
jgi:RNA polymerase sigma-70 factor (ECF subfamily)